jgi:Protein of unknown function (DUF1449)
MWFFDWLVAWANVPYAIALGAASLFYFLQLTGVLDSDGEDADGDAGAPAELAMGPRLPLAFALELGLFSFGVAGLALHAGSSASDLSPSSLLWSAPLALVIALGSTRALARLLAPLLDSRPAAASTMQGLIGSVARVISTRVTSDFGDIAT